MPRERPTPGVYATNSHISTSSRVIAGESFWDSRASASILSSISNLQMTDPEGRSGGSIDEYRRKFTLKIHSERVLASSLITVGSDHRAMIPSRGTAQDASRCAHRCLMGHVAYVEMLNRSVSRDFPHHEFQFPANASRCGLRTHPFAVYNLLWTNGTSHAATRFPCTSRVAFNALVFRKLERAHGMRPRNEIRKRRCPIAFGKLFLAKEETTLVI